MKVNHGTIALIIIYRTKNDTRWHVRSLTDTNKVLTSGQKFCNARKHGAVIEKNRTFGSVPIWDLVILPWLRQVFPNLSCLLSTFHFEYPSVLYRFCFISLADLQTRFGDCNTNLIIAAAYFFPDREMEKLKVTGNWKNLSSILLYDSSMVACVAKLLPWC